MSPELIGVIGFVALFALLAIGMPIGFTMVFVTLVGMVVVGGFKAAFGLFSLAPFTTVANYMFAVIPLFVLMGHLAFVSGVTTDAYKAAYKWLGHLPGGMAIATIAGCAGFAACTGSSAASVGLITSTALPEMEHYNYDHKLSTGCIAGGCTLGILIPPSLPFIIYGLFSGASIGKLFIAGIFPGILLAGLFIGAIYIWVKARPSLGPRGPQTTWREKFDSTKGLWSVILLAILVLGGIWGGIFTPIEAGGIGAFGAFTIALGRRRLSRQDFIASVRDTVKMTGMVIIIIIGALMFNTFLAYTGLPKLLASITVALPVSPTLVVIFILVFYLIGGCLMDVLGLMLLTLPIFIPIMNGLGINLILFGVLTTIMIEMAEITPPIGVNVFILSGMARHIPMYTIFRGIVPFLLCMMVCLALIIAFPEIALFLPETMID